MPTRPDVPTHQALARDIIDMPCISLGPYFVQPNYRGNLTGVPHGSPIFRNVRRT